MPHQCLKCGEAYPDGSPEILRGCADCGGTRFFYTEKPVSEEAREKLRETASEDLKYVIQEMLAGGPSLLEDEMLSKKDWVRIARQELERAKASARPSARGEAGKAPRQDAAGAPAPGPDPEGAAPGTAAKPARTPPSEGAVKSVKELTMPKTKRKSRRGRQPQAPQETPRKLTPVDKVDIITVEEDGVFSIDLEGLLMESPIIIQKDGSYLVHLPSVFEKGLKKA